ncbi:MAG: RNA polymerase sigma-70 factor [Tunicatimonas sp.]
MEQDEASLLHQLAQGNQQALQQLFDRHYVALCRVALRLVHRSEVAEEIVQDVFVYLWEKRGDWQITTSVGAYLARAVRNRCLNHLKSRAARYDWSEEIQDYQHPVDTGPDDTLQVAELTAALERILPQLPEKCGLVFSLIRYEERSYQEVADQLGVSVKAIEYHMGKALRLIRQHLVRYGYGLALLKFIDFLLGEGPSLLS